jgi:hypothetical protein
VKLIRFVAFIVAVFTASIIHADLPLPPISSEYQIKVTVGTDGHVLSTQPDEGLFPNYVQALKQAAPTWRFEPLKINGAPVQTTTWARVKFIRARSTDGNYVYLVKYLGNGAGIDKHKPLPYPNHLYQWHTSAIFEVRFTVETNGDIDKVQLLQAWTSGGRPIGDAMQDVVKGLMQVKGRPMLAGDQPVPTKMFISIPYFTYHSLEKDKPNFGMAIASDSPNRDKAIWDIPESGTAAP